MYKGRGTEGVKDADLVQFVEFYPLLLRAAPTNRTHVQHSITELYKRSPGTEDQSAVCVPLPGHLDHVGEAEVRMCAWVYLFLGNLILAM